jgi:hypothetical protein
MLTQTQIDSRPALPRRFSLASRRARREARDRLATTLVKHFHATRTKHSAPCDLKDALTRACK